MLDDAGKLVDRLSQLNALLVLAESCTGGLVASELAAIPGISEFFCGSAVTYRCDTKVQWLGINQEAPDLHTAVSAEVTSQMTRGALERTPEASISAAVTGHLGPNAPSNLDGVVFIAIAVRTPVEIRCFAATRHQLTTSDRLSRQREAAALVIGQLRDRLDDNSLGDLSDRR